MIVLVQLHRFQCGICRRFISASFDRDRSKAYLLDHMVYAHGRLQPAEPNPDTGDTA